MKTLQRPKYSDNPFLKDLYVEKKFRNETCRVESNKGIVDLGTGDVEQTMMLHSRKAVEGAEFVKIFLSEIKRFYNLTPSGMQLFCFISDNIKYKDIVFIDKIKVAEATKLHSVSIMRGLDNLLENDFIARTMSKDCFFINPSIFFRGDRLLLIKEFKKERNKKDENKQIQSGVSCSVPIRYE